MNLKIPVAGLLTGLLVACSTSNPTPTVQPISKSTPTPISQTGVPQSPETEIAIKPTGDVKPKTKKINGSSKISNSADSIGKSAKLTPAQVKSLISAENSQNPPADKSNIKPQKSRTILPTYVPPGFKVEEFQINPCDLGRGKSNRYTYRITYRNSSKISFNISNYLVCTDGGADPGDVKTIEINSNKFDKVTMNYTAFDKFRNSPYVNGEISSPEPDIPGAFRMLLFFEYYSNSLNLAEATKIMESMEYLNKEN